jgi:hypothetical protein
MHFASTLHLDSSYYGIVLCRGETEAAVNRIQSFWNLSTNGPFHYKQVTSSHVAITGPVTEKNK